MARCKVKIGKSYIVIHGPDEENPFVLVDVTTEAKGYYKWINDHIWDLNRMQKQADKIEMEPGKQCEKHTSAGIITTAINKEHNRTLNRKVV